MNQRRYSAAGEEYPAFIAHYFSPLIFRFLKKEIIRTKVLGNDNEKQ